jgi:hypothetical protein
VDGNERTFADLHEQWRGMSVLLVIVGHTIDFRFAELFATRPFRLLLTEQPFNVFNLAKNIILRPIVLLPGLGVSDSLITTLMMREEALAVDDGARTLRPQRIAISERSNRLKSQ